MFTNLLAKKIIRPRKKALKRTNFFLERPRVLKYPRSFKKYIKNNAVPHRSVDGCLKLGEVGFKALGAYRLRVAQIESVRKFVVKYYKKKKIKIIFNVVFNNPLTKKGLGVRMGKGKGKLDSFVCNIRTGRIFLELDGFTNPGDSWRNKFVFTHVFERLPFKAVSVKRS